EDDHIYFLAHELVNSTDLLGLFALRIGELECYAALLRFLFNRSRLGRAPVALGAGLREPDDDLFLRRFGRGLLGRGLFLLGLRCSSARSDKQSNRKKKNRRADFVNHGSSSLNAAPLRRTS